MNTRDITSKAVVVARYREYYKTDKYLGGLIKVTRLEYSDRFGQEVHITYPNPDKFDKIYVNGKEMMEVRPNTGREKK